MDLQAGRANLPIWSCWDTWTSSQYSGIGLELVLWPAEICQTITMMESGLFLKDFSYTWIYEVFGMDYTHSCWLYSFQLSDHVILSFRQGNGTINNSVSPKMVQHHHLSRKWVEHYIMKFLSTQQMDKTCQYMTRIYSQCTRRCAAGETPPMWEKITLGLILKNIQKQ